MSPERRCNNKTAPDILTRLVAAIDHQRIPLFEQQAVGAAITSALLFKLNMAILRENFVVTDEGVRLPDLNGSGLTVAYCSEKEAFIISPDRPDQWGLRGEGAEIIVPEIQDDQEI